VKKIKEKIVNQRKNMELNHHLQKVRTGGTMVKEILKCLWSVLEKVGLLVVEKEKKYHKDTLETGTGHLKSGALSGIILIYTQRK
jgi:hypothetical protein